MLIEDCPSPNELSGYLLGTLPEDKVDQIAEHVEQCDTCEATVARLESNSDTLIGELKKPQPTGVYATEPERSAAVRLAAELGREPSSVKANGGRKATDVAPTEPLGTIRDYRLLAKLGEGGMGAVYKALHMQLDKVVALKLLPADRMKDKQAVGRFKREMKAVGKLEHPNIVRATDAGQHEGTHYLVMELVEGEDLSALVRRHGTLPIADACEAIRQAAVGLQYAYENGLVHRDIKPSNLMLAVSDQPSAVSQSAIPNPQSAIVKILDMGLALLDEMRVEGVKELTSTGQMMGTLDYMAPEQGDDTHAVDIRADIYSLGATFYKLLCGEAPFAGKKYDTPVKKLMALAIEEPLAIANRREGLPTELAAVVHKMLAKNPDDRYATPSDVADALTPFATGANLASLLSITTAEDAQIGEQVSAAGTDASLKSGSVETAPTIDMPSNDRPAIADSRKVATVAPSSSPRHSLALSHPHAGAASSRHPLIRSTYVIATAAGMAGLIFLGVLLTLRTPQGEIMIEVDDAYADQVAVQVQNGGHEVILGKDNDWRVRIADGDYQISLAKGDDQFKLDRDTLTILHGKTEVVHVRLRKPIAGQVVGQPERRSPGNATFEDGFWQPGPADGHLPGVVGRPADLPGIDRWQVIVPWSSYGPQGELSPDRRYLAWTGPGIGYLCVRDLASGHDVAVWRSGYGSIDWRPDSRALLVRYTDSGHGGAADIFDLEGALPTRIDVDHGNRSPVIWSPDGKWIAAGCKDKTVRLWHADGAPGPVFRGHQSHPSSIAFSPNGRWLASSCPDEKSSDTTVRLWQADGTAGPVLEGHESPVTSIGWKPDSTQLAAGDREGRVFIWNVGGQTERVIDCGATEGGLRLQWSPNGKWIARVTGREMQFWRPDGTKTSAHANVFPEKSVWSPDGEHFAYRVSLGFNARVKVYHPQNGFVAEFHGKSDFERQDGFHRLDHFWSEDSQRICCMEGTSSKWYTLEGKPAGEVATLQATRAVDYRGVAWSPNGDWLATSHQDGTVRFWKEDGTPGHVIPGQSNNRGPIAWTPDGVWLATLRPEYDKATVCLWKPDGTAGPVMKGSQGHAGDIAISPDGQTIAVAREGFVDLWNIDGTGPRKIAELGDRACQHVAWMPEGNWIAVDGASSGGVRLWKPDGTAGPVLKGHEGGVTALQLSPDRAWLAAACRSGKDSVRIWNRDGEPGPSFIGPRDPVVWGPDGRQFLAFKCWTSVLTPYLIFTDGSMKKLDHFRAQWNDDFAWSVGGPLAWVSATYGKIQVLDPLTGEPFWTAVTYRDGQSAVFSPGGQLKFATKTAEEALTYVVQTPDGRLIPYTHAEFQHRINRPPEPRALQWAVEAGSEINLLDNQPALTEEAVIDVEQLPANVGRVEIDLSGNEYLRDEMLRHLVPLSQLASLDVGETDLTDAALEHIGHMSSLSRLNLAATQVTALGLKILTGLSKIEALDLSHTAVDDRVIPHMEKLAGLRELRLAGTEVTAGGLQRLRQSLPKCVVLTRTMPPD